MKIVQSDEIASSKASLHREGQPIESYYLRAKRESITFL